LKRAVPVSGWRVGNSAQHGHGGRAVPGPSTGQARPFRSRAVFYRAVFYRAVFVPARWAEPVWPSIGKGIEFALMERQVNKIQVLVSCTYGPPGGGPWLSHRNPFCSPEHDYCCNEVG
jgi:hypothetical protein